MFQSAFKWARPLRILEASHHLQLDLPIALITLVNRPAEKYVNYSMRTHNERDRVEQENAKALDLKGYSCILSSFLLPSFSFSLRAAAKTRPPTHYFV